MSLRLRKFAIIMNKITDPGSALQRMNRIATDRAPQTGSGNDFLFSIHQFPLLRTQKRDPQPEQALAQALGESCRHPPESNSEIVPGPLTRSSMREERFRLPANGGIDNFVKMGKLDYV